LNRKKTQGQVSKAENECCVLGASANGMVAGTARLAICHRTTVLRCSMFISFGLFAAFRHDEHPVAQNSDECSCGAVCRVQPPSDCLQRPVEACRSCRRDAAPGMKQCWCRDTSRSSPVLLESGL